MINEQVAQLGKVYEMYQAAEYSLHCLAKPKVESDADMEKLRDMILSYSKQFPTESISKRRRLYLYVFLTFTCPLACVGGRLPHGLRVKINDLLYSGGSRTIVSADLGICCLYYKQYEEYRKRADNMIAYIEKSWE